MELSLMPRGDATHEDEAAELAAHAEGRRRDGDADAALALAREALEHDPEHSAARATAALALLDLGREGEARLELERLVAEPPVETVGIEEDELDRAFDDAAAEPDAMRDANEVAYEAMRAAELDAPELGEAPAAESPFHTATMAALLERQGDAEAARSIRATLAQRTQAFDPAGASAHRDRRRSDRIRTLERWLGRLHGGDA